MRRIRFHRPPRDAWRPAAVVCILVLETTLAGCGVARWQDLRETRWREEERWRALAGVFPGPADLAVAGADEALRKAEDERVAWRQACGERFAPRVPASRSQAYFELAEYVEGHRSLAAAAGVACREDERFGFASHGRQGPATAIAARVLRQRDAARDLLEELWASRPYRFDGLQREDPDSGKATRRVAREESDFAAFPPVDSGAWPEGLEAEHLRISFVGHSLALRRWLNRVAGLPGPVVVREVRAEPVASVAGGALPPDAVRFTVIAQVFFSPGGDEAKAGPSS